MAFDQTTRNRLNRFVADSRGVLAKEFTRQLQAIYGMNPVTGEIADINSLAGLTPHQQETAQLLRDTFEHYLAANDHAKGKNKEKENRLAALDRIVREQAFTVLNRLAALRMSEARGFLIESLAKGYDSKGFQLFHRLAGTSLGETGDAYTHYLFSIFDEFALDLSVLFDRFAAQGRLFPSTPVLLELLTLINDDEVAPLWAEDETIGWIYQFWNGRDEIDKMRSASRVPRNSREMAVRNQFFTPRYVVEFLTDNSLGRIWYEMTKSRTKLVDECNYLVKRPNEIFLSEGEQAPELESTEGLSQDELLQQTVYIEHRPLKDPRDIKMLDPACGSMHFGLYCFDLFERIYEEAWDIELAKGSECFIRENNQASLTQSYSDKAEFLTHVPRLIIENNIHGVDIDPRAAQVAGMSLWQRAHNSWQKASVKPQLRPQITKSNIVCAEPMPGEKELLQEFSSQLKPTVLGQLVEVIFEKMQFAGEAGTLLKIEKEIEDAIAGAKAVWQQQNQALSQFPELAKVAKRQKEGKGEVDFDVSDIDDEGFWQQAEQKILEALAAYASSTSADMNEQKRLFASDAAKGFAFIDLCKKRFDVVLMNPPFGDSSKNTKALIDNSYPCSKTNLLACFIERGVELVQRNGLVGALVSRTGYYLSSLEQFRKKILNSTTIQCHADLGSNVLDAMVEVAASVFCKTKYNGNHSSPYYRLLTSKSKRADLLRLVKNIGLEDKSFFGVNQNKYLYVNGAPFVYWISLPVLEKLSSFQSIEPTKASIRVGLQTGSDFRFLRLWWEVPAEKIIKCSVSDNIKSAYLSSAMSSKTAWCYYSKIDKASLFASPIHLVVNWGHNGEEIKAYHRGNGHSPSKYVMSENLYFLPGVSYMLRSSRIIPYVVPKGVIPAAGRSQIYPTEGYEEEVLSLVSSNIASAVARFKGENFGQPKFQNSMVGSVPYTSLEGDSNSQVWNTIKNKFNSETVNLQNLETAVQYNGPDSKNVITQQKLDRNTLLGEDIETLIAKKFGFEEHELHEIELDLKESINQPQWMTSSDSDSKKLAQESHKSDHLISWAIGVVCGRFDKLKVDQAVTVSDPYAPLPNRSPAMLEYAKQKTDIVLTNDRFNNLNINTLVEDVLEDAGFKTIENLDTFLHKDFFSYHLKMYSMSKKQAPIYWPLQSSKGSLVVWLYYPSLTIQTLVTCINDFIEPKLLRLNEEQSSINVDIGASKSDQLKRERLLDEISELEDFKENLIALSKFWVPDLNDGVQITAAPLWRLFQHKAWQKKLKQTWEKLEGGEYDWAHLAFSTWPERVLKKCHADRSLAIAHDVEADLWHEVEVIKGKKKEPVWEWQPKPLSDAELHAYIREKIASDDRLKLYRSNQSASANGGAL